MGVTKFECLIVHRNIYKTLGGLFSSNLFRKILYTKKYGEHTEIEDCVVCVNCIYGIQITQSKVINRIVCVKIKERILRSFM